MKPNLKPLKKLKSKQSEKLIQHQFSAVQLKWDVTKFAHVVQERSLSIATELNDPLTGVL